MTDSQLALLPAALLLLQTDWRVWPGYKIGLVVVYLVVDALAVFSGFDQLWYWWLAPFFLGWYLLSQRFLEPQVEHKEAA